MKNKKEDKKIEEIVKKHFVKEINNSYSKGVLHMMVISLLIIGGAFIYVNYHIISEIGYTTTIEDLSLQRIIENCSNMSLKDSAKCVNKLTNNFYIYNMSKLGKDFLIDESFNELVTEGGVCKQWSQYYCFIGKELGFNTKRQLIVMNSSNRHTYCDWSDSYSYASLDGNNLKIYEFTFK